MKVIGSSPQADNCFLHGLTGLMGLMFLYNIVGSDTRKSTQELQLGYVETNAVV